MKKFIRKEYTIEDQDQYLIDISTNKFIAIIKCLFNREAVYVCEYDVFEDPNDPNYADVEALGYIFIKRI